MTKLASKLSLNLIFLGFVVTLLISTSLSLSFSKSKINKSKESNETTIVVQFRNAPSSVVFDTISKQSFSSRSEKINALVSALKLNAATSQKEVVDYLQSKAIPFSSYWLSNTLVIHHVTPDIIIDVASHGEIREPVVAKLGNSGIPPTHSESKTILANQSPSSSLQWGLEKLNAKEFWDYGFNGSGIVIANIDSGVRSSHRILKNNFLHNYGWYDPVKKTQNPEDDNGHGTFSMGILVGSEGYGVAPGASYISCRACLQSECLEENILACGQFVLCPTDPKGQNQDCSKTPHVVISSWTTNDSESNSFYDDVIAAWHIAEIIPVFAAGDNGPICKSMGAPGHHEKVITVGSTNSQDFLSSFSSMGPAQSGRVKPDISAPGEEILSASNSGDDDFVIRSGTGAAACHVAGALALYLHQLLPTINYRLLYGNLQLNAVKVNLTGPGRNCGNVTEDQFPNNAFGHGRSFINVYYIPIPT